MAPVGRRSARAHTHNRQDSHQRKMKDQLNTHKLGRLFARRRRRG